MIFSHVVPARGVTQISFHFNLFTSHQLPVKLFILPASTQIQINQIYDTVHPRQWAYIKLTILFYFIHCLLISVRRFLDAQSSSRRQIELIWIEFFPKVPPLRLRRSFSHELFMGSTPGFSLMERAASKTKSSIIVPLPKQKETPSWYDNQTWQATCEWFCFCVQIWARIKIRAQQVD